MISDASWLKYLIGEADKGGDPRFVLLRWLDDIARSPISAQLLSVYEAAAITILGPPSFFGRTDKTRLTADQQAEMRRDHGWTLYVDMLMLEVEEFLCGSDRYHKERDELNGQIDYRQDFVISTISTAIAATLGSRAEALKPLIILALVHSSNIGVNAWCKLQKERRANDSWLPLQSRIEDAGIVEVEARRHSPLSERVHNMAHWVKRTIVLRAATLRPPSVTRQSGSHDDK